MRLDTCGLSLDSRASDKQEDIRGTQWSAHGECSQNARPRTQLRLCYILFTNLEALCK